MPQGEDLHVLVPIAYRKKTHDREHVRRRQIGQSQQHSRSSCRDDHLDVTIPALHRGEEARRPRTQGATTLTCTDGLFGMRNADIDTDLDRLAAELTRLVPELHDKRTAPQGQQFHVSNATANMQIGLSGTVPSDLRTDR